MGDESGKALQARRKNKQVKVYADYSRGCEVCGYTPVVSLTGLCGACTFGSSDCLDPKEWEGAYEPAS